MVPRDGYGVDRTRNYPLHGGIRMLRTGFLREGAAASKRLGRPITPTMEKQADEMEALRKKILETTTG